MTDDRYGYFFFFEVGPLKMFRLQNLVNVLKSIALLILKRSIYKI